MYCLLYQTETSVQKLMVILVTFLWTVHELTKERYFYEFVTDANFVCLIYALKDPDQETRIGNLIVYDTRDYCRILIFSSVWMSQDHFESNGISKSYEHIDLSLIQLNPSRFIKLIPYDREI